MLRFVCLKMYEISVSPLKVSSNYTDRQLRHRQLQILLTCDTRVFRTVMTTASLTDVFVMVLTSR